MTWSKLGVVSLVLLVASLLSFPVALACKYLVDILCLGHSLSKTLLLLAFLVALSVGHQKIKSLPEALPKLFAFGLALMSLGTLLQYLWYCRFYALPNNGWSAVVRDGFWTMIRLDHSHTAKAMLSSLPKNLALTTDVGYAFGAIFPQWLLWAQLAAFLFLLVLCFGSCLFFMENRRFGESLSFILTSFVLVKCVIDGGPLIYEFWAAAPVFVYLVFGRKAAIASGAVFSAYLLSLFWWKFGALNIVIFNIVPAIFAFGLPLSYREKRAGLVWVLLGFVLLAPALRWQLVPGSRIFPYAYNTLRYGLAPLEKDWHLYLVSPKKLPTEHHLISVRSETFDPASKLYLYDVSLLETSTPYELCQSLGLQLVRRPVSWYRGPVACQARVFYLSGKVEETLASPLIKSKKVKREGGRVFLDLQLSPGVNRDLAISMLGPELSVVDQFSLFYPKTEE